MKIFGKEYILNQNTKKVLGILFILLVLLFIFSIVTPKFATSKLYAYMAEEMHNQPYQSRSINNRSNSNDYKIDSSLFEMKRYEIEYKEEDTKKVQDKIKTLKDKKFIIFDGYSESIKYSKYTIKVKREKSQEILNFLQKLSPYKLNLYVENIKKSVNSTLDKEKLLSSKLEKLEAILNDATKSYTELLQLAKEKNNLNALTKLIDLKINTLNRLTNERSAILVEINSIKRNREELFEKVNYVIFEITIREFLYFDIEKSKESWKNEIQKLAININSLLQTITVSIFSFLIKIIELLIYLIFALYILKLIFFIIKSIFKLNKLSFFEKVDEKS